ncbi:MAG: hypothetical protein JSR62_02045 [Nitrospira sp.]|nr:hypothetical protein [Nitrospira sp.]
MMPANRQGEIGGPSIRVVLIVGENPLPVRSMVLVIGGALSAVKIERRGAL